MTEHPCILNTISLSDVQTTHINFTETVDTESTKKLGLALRLKGMKYRYESCSKFKKKKGEGEQRCRVVFFGAIDIVFGLDEEPEKKKE